MKKKSIVGFGGFTDDDNYDSPAADDLNQIIEMAKKGKTMREIAEYLDPDNISLIMAQFNDKNSELHEAFQLGIASQGPEIKLLSAQAEIETLNLIRQKKVDAMISDFLCENSTDL
jgi:hypothetical protein